VTDLVIVRHAESVWNAEGRWQGWADPPLSPRGAEQATQAGRALVTLTEGIGAPDVLASSDLRRARQTAELLFAGLPATGARPDGNEAGGNEAGGTGRSSAPAPAAIVVDSDLREYDTGDWTGLTRHEIAARWPEELAEWDAGRLDHTPGGEDRAVFVARLFGALERLRRAAPDGRVVAVSHGRAIHAMASAIGGPDARVGHLSGWRLSLGTAPVLVSAVSLLDPSGEPAAPGSSA
jgi:glucosyl-3-phosphoglycerate phosphatase